MPGQLDLSIGTLSKVGFLGLNELQVVLLYVRQKLLETLLLRREAAFVIRLLNEGSGSLDALHVRQENWVSSLGHLPRALELMDLEPVLLEAPLWAVLDLLTLALRAPIKGDKLLLKLSAVPLHEAGPLILFGGFLQRAHFIFTLAYVDHLVIGRLRYLMIRRVARSVIQVILKMGSSVVRIEWWPIILLLSFGLLHQYFFWLLY